MSSRNLDGRKLSTTLKDECHPSTPHAQSKKQLLPLLWAGLRPAERNAQPDWSPKLYFLLCFQTSHPTNPSKARMWFDSTVAMAGVHMSTATFSVKSEARRQTRAPNNLDIWQIKLGATPRQATTNGRCLEEHDFRVSRDERAGERCQPTRVSWGNVGVQMKRLMVLCVYWGYRGWDGYHGCRFVRWKCAFSHHSQAQSYVPFCL